MKRIISIVLCITLCASIFIHTDAAEKNKLVTNNKLKKLTEKQLSKAAEEAQSDKEAQTVFNEIVRRSRLSTNAKKSSYYVMDKYIKVLETSLKNHRLDIKYKVKAKIPNNVNITIGYEYPGQLRMSGTQYGISNKKGTFIRYIYTRKFVCGIRAFAHLSAIKYSEQKNFKSFFDAPSGKTTSYKTVSKKEAGAFFTVKTIAGIIGTVYPKKKILKVLSATVNGVTTILGAADSVNFNLGYVEPRAGQYYRVITYYEKYKLCIRTTIWYNKNHYNKKAKPILDHTNKYDLPRI